ncbi:metal ABC transporter substrate-binding protein [Dinoroseobacter sp. S76]|uniref:metal ABC transporter substrate-binding protein n=1 Tax=Dinoroseobacter sp. S76 TaxID=3415124 RepID=UPI003C7B7ED6
MTLGLALLVASAATAQDRPRVVAVNQVLHDFAAQLLDGAAEVVFPVPEGVDPSFWRPSIADISQIQSADLILLNGAGFASWIDRVSLPRSRLVNTSAGIRDRFIVTESITHSHGDGGEHSHEGLASYTWLDPTLASAQAEAIAAALAIRGLAKPEEVYPRLAELTAELTALDTMAREALSAAQGATIVATHPRYQYLARRYDLLITSLEWEAGAMPTPDDLAELERLAPQDGGVLIWEAEPPRAAIDATDALGLRSVVFAPWARAGGDGSFVDAYSNAVQAIAGAAGEGPN